LVLEAGAAFGGAPMAPNDIKAAFFNGQPFTAATPSGTKFTMTFTPDGKTTRQALAPPNTKNVGTWKLSSTGFCTSWERKKQNCFTVVPISDNKWSIQQIATTIAVTAAVWSK
jgi:hypothetical protein